MDPAPNFQTNSSQIIVEPVYEESVGWGMADRSHGWVYRPRNAGEVTNCLQHARDKGLTVAHRGAGLSYGDVALNGGGAIIDLSALDSVLRFDADAGHITVGAGCTYETLWKTTLPDGWWPPVVPGTMKVTLGGAAAVNVHGKNHFTAGGIGNHIRGLVLLSGAGELETITAEGLPDRLREVVGSCGLTGTILEITLELKHVTSGYLDVRMSTNADLRSTLDALDAGATEHDYSVAWIDCFAGGAALGRGLVHTADYLPEGHELDGRGLSPAAQALPKRIMGILPSRHAWRFLKPLTSDFPMRLLAAAKYRAGRVGKKRYVQSHAAFHFLLDYLPDWKYAYRPGGLIQYQMFVPRDAAAQAFSSAIQLQHQLGVFSYLGVLKRHRQDEFAGRYCSDGFSLAMDFPVRSDSSGLKKLLREYESLRKDVGGTIYSAKDSVGVGMVPGGRDPVFDNDLVRRWRKGGGEREGGGGGREE